MVSGWSRLSRALPFSGLRTLPPLLVGLLFILVLLPTVIVKIQPSAYYINHLARTHIIAFGGDALLSRFYEIQWALVPAMAIDLIVPPLAHLVGLFTAGKLFIMTYMVLILTGAYAIHYALFRRFSVGPCVAALFIYNGVQGDGDVNYLFGVGVSLWGAAAWIAMRQLHPALRAAVSLIVVLMLFVAHLAAVVLYGVGILGYEAWLFNERRRIDRQFLIDACVLAGPFFVVPLLMALSPIADLSGIKWLLFEKAHGLYKIAQTRFQPENRSIDLVAALGMAASAGWAWWRGYFRLHAAGWFLIAFAVPVYLALPSEYKSTDIDVRLPTGVLFFVLGMLDWRLPTARSQYVFLAIVFLFAFVRVGAVAASWMSFNDDVAEMEASLLTMKPGSRILIAQPHNVKIIPGLIYLPCLAMIERSSLVSLAYSRRGRHLLAVKPPFREFAGDDDVPIDINDLLAEKFPLGAAPEGRMYWKDWSKHYDYLYLMGTTDEPNPAPDRLVEQYHGAKFRLYRILAQS